MCRVVIHVVIHKLIQRKKVKKEEAQLQSHVTCREENARAFPLAHMTERHVLSRYG